MTKEIEYTDGGKFAHVDGIRFTRDEHTGYFLSTKKVGDSRIRLHVYVWEKHHGKVPHGFHVHHVSHDKSDNEIANLELVYGPDHSSHHGATMTEEQRERSRENIRNIAKKAAAWHGSEEGRAWHSEHGKKTWAAKVPVAYICDNCGSPFESTKISYSGNKFCSNKCKTAFRRKSGVDDVSFPCESCGNEITCNKYAGRRRCGECGTVNDVPKNTA